MRASRCDVRPAGAIMVETLRVSLLNRRTATFRPVFNGEMRSISIHNLPHRGKHHGPKGCITGPQARITGPKGRITYSNVPVQSPAAHPAAAGPPAPGYGKPLPAASGGRFSTIAAAAAAWPPPNPHFLPLFAGCPHYTTRFVYCQFDMCIIPDKKPRFGYNNFRTNPSGVASCSLVIFCGGFWSRTASARNSWRTR